MLGGKNIIEYEKPGKDFVTFTTASQHVLRVFVTACEHRGIQPMRWNWDYLLLKAMKLLDMDDCDLKNLAYLVCLTLSAATTDWAAIHSTMKLYQAGLLNIEKLIEVKNDDIEKCIWCAGIQHTHSQFLKDLAVELKSEHGGKVPCKGDAIEKLPGVARKTRVILRNEGFGVWEGIGADIHLRQLSIAFDYMKEEKGDTGEHAEAALCEWCQISQYRDINKVFGSFAQLVTQDFQTVKKTVEHEKRSWHLVKAIGDYIHKPCHVELLWFMIWSTRHHYFISKLSK